MLKQLKGNELDALNIDNWTLAELQKAVKQFKVIEDMKQTDTQKLAFGKNKFNKGFESDDQNMKSK